jgi:hypothetical protein
LPSKSKLDPAEKALRDVAEAALAVVKVEDLYRGLDREVRRQMLNAFEIQHREAMDALRAALAEL